MTTTKTALVTRGGWDGHQPAEAIELFIPHLKEHGDYGLPDGFGAHRAGRGGPKYSRTPACLALVDIANSGVPVPSGSATVRE